MKTIINKSCPIHIANAEYGCILNSEKFQTEGGILPVNGKITWFYDTNKKSTTITETDIIKGIKESFALIEQYVDTNIVKFEQVLNPSQAQVVIGFYNNDDVDLPQNFETTTLAYAFLGNRTTAFNIVGDVFFNDENFNWSLGTTFDSIDFIKVCVHELLHAVVGLHHQTIDNTGILFPSYNPNIPIKFIQDTINGIQSIFGKPNDQEPDIPEDPTVVPQGCLSFLKKLFISPSELNRLKERQLIVIASELDISATKKDLKKDTLEKIWNVLKPNKNLP